MSKIESYQNRFRSNFQEQGVEFQRHLLRFNSKRKCKRKFQQAILQNSLACHVQLFTHTPHHTVVSSALPIPFIILLCLQLSPQPSSHCVPSILPIPIITLLCLQLSPHPSSHCCAFNFAHTLHHTVVSHHPWVTCHMCRTLDAPLLFITVPDNLPIDSKAHCTL